MNRAALLVALAAGLVLPSTAAAKATCSWDLSTHVLSVNYTGGGGTATLAVNASGVIEMNTAVCGATANVHTVDTIVVKDTSGANSTLLIDLANGGFAPGATAEAASSEIEFNVDMGAGTNDIVELLAAPAGSAVTLGQQGANLDPVQDKAGGPAGLDVDMTLAGVEQIGLEGAAGDDVWDASGGDATGSATNIDTFGDGAGGHDVLRGGNGDDIFEGNAGDDTMAGGNGDDIAYYVQAPAAVDVDLRTTAPQNTGSDGVDTLSGVEDLRGSNYNDVLRGNDGPNSIAGDDGNDTIYGYGGSDQLTGGTGSDSIFTGAGQDSANTEDMTADTIDCGTGTDTLHTDSIDVLVGCAGTPPDPTPTPTPTATPGGTPTPTPTADPTATPGGDPTQTGGGQTGGGQTGSGQTGSGGDPQGTNPTGTKGGDTAGAATKGLTIKARKQGRRAIRKHGLRVVLTAPADVSVAVHAGSAKDVFWALKAGRPLTVRLRIPRKALRKHRARITAVVDGQDGTTSTVSKTVRL